MDQAPLIDAAHTNTGAGLPAPAATAAPVVPAADLPTASRDVTAKGFEAHRVQVTEAVQKHAQTVLEQQQSRNEQAHQKMILARQTGLAAIRSSNAAGTGDIADMISKLPGTVQLQFTIRCDMPFNAADLPVGLDVMYPDELGASMGHWKGAAFDNRIVITGANLEALPSHLVKDSLWERRKCHLVSVEIESETPPRNHAIRLTLKAIADRERGAERLHRSINGTIVVDPAGTRRRDGPKHMYVGHRTLLQASSPAYSYEQSVSSPTSANGSNDHDARILTTTRALLGAIEADLARPNESERSLRFYDSGIVTFHVAPKGSTFDAAAAALEARILRIAQNERSDPSEGSVPGLDEALKVSRVFFATSLVSLWNVFAAAEHSHISWEKTQVDGFFTVTQEAWNAFLSLLKMTASLTSVETGIEERPRLGSFADPISSNQGVYELLACEAWPDIFTGVIYEEGAMKALSSVNLSQVGGSSDEPGDLCVVRGTATIFVE